MLKRLFVVLAAAWLVVGALAPRNAEAQWSPDPATTPGYVKAPFPDLAGGAVLLSGYRISPTRTKLWGPNQIMAFGYNVSGWCPDGQGGVIGVAASGDDNGTIVTSRLSVNGSRLWGPPFSELVVGSGIHFRSGPVVAPDGANGAFFAWLDGRITTATTEIYAQHVNAAGATIWAASGAPACSAENDQVEPAVVADGSGGAFVVWRDFRTAAGPSGDIYGQHLNASGAPLWGANGIAICAATGVQQSPVVASDGAGGVYVAWWDARGGNFRIFLQRMDGAGNPVFAVDGIPVANGAGDQLLPSLLADGSSGVFVCWEDHRAGGADGSDIYVTRISGGGTLVWPALTPVCTEPHLQTYPSMIADGLGGVILDWCDARAPSPTASTTLYTQRFGPSGTALWTTNGVQVDVTDAGTRSRAIATDGTGGAYYEGGHGLARVLADGTPAWQGSFTVTNASVADVAGDEGGFARLTFDPAAAEALQVAPFPTTYLVFRKIPGALVVRDASALGSGSPRNGLLTGLFPPSGAWEVVSSVPAYGPSKYSLLVPTHADSSSAGPALDSYCVMTQTASHGVNLYSDVVSGYSVDNLPPGVPSLLVGGRTGGASVRLAWQPSTAADLWHYSVYRGNAPSFAADAAHRIAVPTAANYLDGAFVDGAYYKVTATDRHGNESPAAQLAPANITGVAPSLAPRVSYAAIVGANPFSRRAVIEYGLAQAGRVDLAIYDLAGRKVASLVDGERPAGVQRVTWEGAGDSGSRLEPGVYLARFEAPGVSRTLRLVRVE